MLPDEEPAEKLTFHQFEDAAIIHMSVTPIEPLKPKKGRKLEKYQVQSNSNIGECLADLKHQKFDQFENRKSTYKESNYNTTMADEASLTSEQIKHAAKVEAEINKAA